MLTCVVYSFQTLFRRICASYGNCESGMVVLWLFRNIMCNLRILSENNSNDVRLIGFALPLSLNYRLENNKIQFFHKLPLQTVKKIDNVKLI